MTVLLERRELLLGVDRTDIADLMRQNIAVLDGTDCILDDIDAVQRDTQLLDARDGFQVDVIREIEDIGHRKAAQHHLIADACKIALFLLGIAVCDLIIRDELVDAVLRSRILIQAQHFLHLRDIIVAVADERIGMLL